ncbi:FAD synthetase [Streptomyces sp. NPDC089424]|uniref:FAD synthetase n=1 Tax=Streptomyces sp. NPDC089424 TaxID=3365917 RepID=UPI00382E24E2
MEVLGLEVPGEKWSAGGGVRVGGAPSSAKIATVARVAKVAIGAFDGVHLGHRQVLDGCDTVLTFDPHPRQVLDPGRAPSLLSDRRQKLHKLRSLGIRQVAIVPFDHAWSRVTAEEFVERVVVEQLGARFVSVGQGFRFGARGAGTAGTFESYPGLSTRVVPLVTRGSAGEAISSTRIRRLISEGDVASAGELLGSALALPAVVGDGGRLLISARFARPAPGCYLGSVDGHPRRLRVCQDRSVAGAGAARTGSPVQVTFVRQTA